MNRTQKILFSNQFMGEMLKSVLAEVPKMPEDWDGIELREYIRRVVSAEAGSFKMEPKRRRAFNNHCICFMRY